MNNIIHNAVDQGDSRARLCPVGGCGRPLQNHHCLCASHWNALSFKARSDIMLEFGLRRGSRRHLEAIHDAILWLESAKAAVKPSAQYEFDTPSPKEET